MFIPSECKITLSPSTPFLRLVLLIQAAALGLLYLSAWPLGLKVPIALFLLLQAIYFILKPMPHPGYLSLCYEQEKWWLYTKDPLPIAFASLRMINMGLFFLLLLQEEKGQQYLILFKDQLSPEKHWFLRIQACNFNKRMAS